jgi:DNA-binding transcriptional ArsR family regulator
MCKVYPSLYFEAQRKKLNISSLDFVIPAKGQCRGHGTIPVAALKKYFKELGISKSTYNRRLKAAMELGLVSIIKSKRGTYYKLASWAQIAVICGCEHLGNPVNVDDKRLVSKGGRAYLWSAYLLKNEGTPHSRAAMQFETGAPKSTQIQREKLARIKRSNNYEVMPIPIEEERGCHYEKDLSAYVHIAIGQQGDPRCFVDAAGNLYKRLASSAIDIPDVSRAPRGRTSKVNAAIKRMINAPVTKASIGNLSESVLRIYAFNAKQVKTLSKWAKRKGIDAEILQRWKYMQNYGRGWLMV